MRITSHIVDGAAEGGESEATLRRVRRLYITRDNVRAAIVKLVNATLEIRQGALWGDGTACGTAAAEQVLRRFTRGGPKHPTYQALEALGRAVDTNPSTGPISRFRRILAVPQR